MNISTRDDAVALMNDPQNKPFWASARVLDTQLASFECHFPWWVSGSGWRNGDVDHAESTVCFAIFAKDEDHAMRLFTECFDDGVTPDLEWRFCGETTVDVIIGSGRFCLNRDWMVWPENSQPV